MNTKFIEKANEIRRECIENELNYLDSYFCSYKEEIVRQKILSREAQKACEKYKKLLPFIIFTEESYNFKKIDTHKICPEYILSKYTYLLKDDSGNFRVDGELLVDVCSEIIKLNNEYRSVTLEEIEKAYRIIFKERIKEDKNKIKRALRIKPVKRV